jgi:hypothetical protein
MYWVKRGGVMTDREFFRLYAVLVAVVIVVMFVLLAVKCIPQQHVIHNSSHIEIGDIK